MSYQRKAEGSKWGSLERTLPQRNFQPQRACRGRGSWPHAPLPVKAQAWPRAARKATGPFPEAQVQARPRARPPCQGRRPPPPREAVVPRCGGDPRGRPASSPTAALACFHPRGLWPWTGQAPCGTGHPQRQSMINSPSPQVLTKRWHGFPGSLRGMQPHPGWQRAWTAASGAPDLSCLGHPTSPISPFAGKRVKSTPR